MCEGLDKLMEYSSPELVDRVRDQLAQGDEKAASKTVAAILTLSYLSGYEVGATTAITTVRDLLDVGATINAALVGAENAAQKVAQWRSGGRLPGGIKVSVDPAFKRRPKRRKR